MEQILQICIIVQLTVQQKSAEKKGRAAKYHSDYAMVEFYNVNKAYNEKCQPLKNINLRVSKGEVLVICGPSGAGKSTLLRTINRLERIDSGEIIIDGKDLYDHKTNLTALRAEIGMVFQHLNLYPHKTALENITLASRMVRGFSKKQAEEKAMILLEEVGLAHKRDAFPVQLSGGEQQRTAIARSLALGPKIMLFDEPTSSLDPELTNEVLGVILALAQEGMTMIIVTHELGFAQKAATRIAFMDNGEIVETGTPDKMLVNPEHPRTREFVSNILQV